MDGTCLIDTFNYLSQVIRKPHWCLELPSQIHYYTVDVSRENEKRYCILHANVISSWGKQHPHAVIYDKEKDEIIEVSNCFKHKPVRLPYKMWCIMGKTSDVKMYNHDEFVSLLIKHKRISFYHLDEPNELEINDI